MARATVKNVYFEVIGILRGVYLLPTCSTLRTECDSYACINSMYRTRLDITVRVQFNFLCRMLAFFLTTHGHVRTSINRMCTD